MHSYILLTNRSQTSVPHPHIYFFSFSCAFSCLLSHGVEGQSRVMCILVIYMALSLKSDSELFHSNNAFTYSIICLLTSRLYSMAPNFTDCGIKFNSFASNNSTYNFTGKVHGIFSERARQPPLITYGGCKHICGPGTQYYTWANISSTITTWVMMMAQPFRSIH